MAICVSLDIIKQFWLCSQAFLSFEIFGIIICFYLHRSQDRNELMSLVPPCFELVHLIQGTDQPPEFHIPYSLSVFQPHKQQYKSLQYWTTIPTLLKLHLFSEFMFLQDFCYLKNYHLPFSFICDSSPLSLNYSAHKQQKGITVLYIS